MSKVCTGKSSSRPDPAAVGRSSHAAEPRRGSPKVGYGAVVTEPWLCQVLSQAPP